MVKLSETLANTFVADHLVPRPDSGLDDVVSGEPGGWGDVLAAAPTVAASQKNECWHRDPSDLDDTEGRDSPRPINQAGLNGGWLICHNLTSCRAEKMLSAPSSIAWVVPVYVPGATGASE